MPKAGQKTPGTGRSRDAKGRFARSPISGEVKEILKAATPEAARLLIACIGNEDAPMNQRMDAAKTVLDRVYGKASQPIDGAVDGEIQFVLSSELQELAK